MAIELVMSALVLSDEEFFRRLVDVPEEQRLPVLAGLSNLGLHLAELLAQASGRPGAGPEHVLQLVSQELAARGN
ncbi:MULTISPECIES: hypothetical protein [unclassified Pseudonocardia]|uniref:hypothetical protein n=1 Tax=unclassified Pseudonocardia TaxID=2619320 RepID=UPI001115372C|nr:hypothetical protein [Pseudonocardia sp. Ae707_Ps1]